MFKHALQETSFRVFSNEYLLVNLLVIDASKDAPNINFLCDENAFLYLLETSFQYSMI